MTAESKGTVEALFTWVTRKFSHRLPGTTKATPTDRGAYDSGAEAQKAGITLDILEKLFIQSIVDAYLQEWDHLRRGRRISLWEDSVREKGVPNYLGSPDDLKLLLMKAVNRKNPVTGRYAISPYRGLSFLGYRYVSQIDIYFDRRDISVIYLFEEGELRGEAYCTELLGQRMSIWEAQALRKSDREQAKEAEAVSLENRQRIQQEAAGGRRIHSLETKRLEKQRQMDLQRQEIHPEQVQTTLHVLANAQSAPPPAQEPSGLLPPAIPEDDAQVRSVVPVRIRKWRSNDE